PAQVETTRTWCGMSGTRAAQSHPPKTFSSGFTTARPPRMRRVTELVLIWCANWPGCMVAICVWSDPKTIGPSLKCAFQLSTGLLELHEVAHFQPVPFCLHSVRVRYR